MSLYDDKDNNPLFSSTGYMDPNSFTSQVCARTMYDYKARRDDELSFSRGALITNVNQQVSPGTER